MFWLARMWELQIRHMMSLCRRRVALDGDVAAGYLSEFCRLQQSNVRRTRGFRTSPLTVSFCCVLFYNFYTIMPPVLLSVLSLMLTWHESARSRL